MISIVIPNYNGEKYLQDCLDSIKAQTYIDYEVIIIDNASTDSDYEWVKAQPDIIFKQLSQNFGFSKAVNEGFKVSRGEYVLLLNNDTVLEPSFLREIRQAIEVDYKIFAVSSKMISYHNRNIIDDAGDEYTLLGWTLKCGDGKPVEAYTKPREIFSACAGAALYRKSIFDEIGYFDEHFFAYMEDVDISYRARIYGYQNTYCPTACVYHIGSATSGSRHNAFKVKLAARNNIYVPYKNMPWIQLVINIPFLSVGCLIKWIYFTKKGLGKAYRQGFLEGLMGVGKIEKVPFKWKNSKHYLKIEVLLVLNLIRYVKEYIGSN